MPDRIGLTFVDTVSSSFCSINVCGSPYLLIQNQRLNISANGRHVPHLLRGDMTRFSDIASPIFPITSLTEMRSMIVDPSDPSL